MTERGKFIEALRDSLVAQAEQDSALRPFVDAMQNAGPVAADCISDEPMHPLMPQLDVALDAAQGPPELLDSVAAISSADGWKQVYAGEGINADVADFMLDKQIAGPRESLVRGPIDVGLFLLAANFEYPMHSHAAQEVYYVHSGAIDIQNGTESQPRRLEPGQYSITPPEVPHALYTGDKPVLIIYVWTGDVTAPVWWWVNGEDGNWTKILAKTPQVLE